MKLTPKLCYIFRSHFHVYPYVKWTSILSTVPITLCMFDYILKQVLNYLYVTGTYRLLHVLKLNYSGRTLWLTCCPCIDYWYIIYTVVIKIREFYFTRRIELWRHLNHCTVYPLALQTSSLCSSTSSRLLINILYTARCHGQPRSALPDVRVPVKAKVKDDARGLASSNVRMFKWAMTLSI